MVKKDMKKKNPFLYSKGTEKRQTIKVMDQTGKVKSVLRDLGRQALLPGKRISRTGKEYWETRVNRSDRAGSKT